MKTYFPFELSLFVLVLIKTLLIFHKTCHFASQVNVFKKSLDICTGKQVKITEEERQLFAALSEATIKVISLFFWFWAERFIYIWRSKT